MKTRKIKDKIVRINSHHLVAKMKDIVKVEESVLRLAIEYFVESILDELKEGNVVHVKNLGYFHLAVKNKPYQLSRSTLSDRLISCPYMVVPYFQSTSTNIARFSMQDTDEMIEKIAEYAESLFIGDIKALVQVMLERNLINQSKALIEKTNVDMTGMDKSFDNPDYMIGVYEGGIKYLESVIEISERAIKDSQEKIQKLKNLT